MPLEDLLQLARKLSKRIDQHGAALRQSEALTRYALIDPLLRELGWNTSDPDMVIPEYKSGNGRADYALMNNGSPAMMVEAKSLDTNLGTVPSQGIQYCLEQGTRFFCVTDGRQWEIYETHKPVPIHEKRIVRFDLKDNPARVCLNALALWRPVVESGKISVGQTPVVEPNQPLTNPSEAESARIPTPIIQQKPGAPAPESGEWLSLSGFNPVKGSPRPIEILFPDNSNAQIQNWKSIIVKVAGWLVDRNLLGPGHCPIQFASSHARYVVHTIPTHPNGKSFFAHVQVGSLHIETHANSATAVRKARLMIEAAGQDPAQFKVRLP